jgi:hypothetical protein
MTMAEVLIAMALFGLLSTSIGLLLKHAMLYMRRAETRGELQRVSLFVLSSLSRELAESSSDCLGFDSGSGWDGALLFATPRGADDQVIYDDSLMQWRGWVGVGLQSDSGLLLRAYQPLSTNTPFKPSPLGVDVLAMLSDSNRRTRVLARNVTGFQATLGREVNLTLRVEVREGDDVSTLTTETAVRPMH